MQGESISILTLILEIVAKKLETIYVIDPVFYLATVVPKEDAVTQVVNTSLSR